MQEINWELLREKLQKCWDEHVAYNRQFKMRNGNIIQVIKYTHTDFRIIIFNIANDIIYNQKINNVEECYNTIYTLLNQ